MDFMDVLEAKVGQVCERLEETLEQVQALKARIAILEKENASLETAASAPVPERDRWREERDEIRARVDGLIEKLEALSLEA